MNKYLKMSKWEFKTEHTNYVYRINFHITVLRKSKIEDIAVTIEVKTEAS